jgi:hypothetical protein
MAKQAKGSALHRKSETRALAPILVVACEGKTEWQVLESVRAKRRIAAARVVIARQCGDPLAVVERAIEERREQEQKRLLVSHCFAVFDRDEHKRYSEAKARAASANVGLGISNPCIEIWLIWLVQEQSAALTRQEAQRICRVHKGYDHDEHPFAPDSALVDANFSAADLRAERQRQRHLSAGNPVDDNPSSSFGMVVAAMLRAGTGHRTI